MYSLFDFSGSFTRSYLDLVENIINKVFLFGYCYKSKRKLPEGCQRGDTQYIEIGVRQHLGSMSFTLGAASIYVTTSAAAIQRR